MTDVLIESALRHLPEGEPIFSEDELTDQSLRVLVARSCARKFCT
jgi:GTPase Era involved in 16S rRNA processing